MDTAIFSEAMVFEWHSIWEKRPEYLEMSDSPLDRLTIPRPCPVSWDSMTGDERVRLCSQCKTNVYNVSDMNRKDAEALLSNKEGHLCVKIIRRQDGTIITRDCPLVVDILKRTLQRCLAAAAFVIAIFFPAKVLAQTNETDHQNVELTMSKDLLEQASTAPPDSSIYNKKPVTVFDRLKVFLSPDWNFDRSHYSITLGSYIFMPYVVQLKEIENPFPIDEDNLYGEFTLSELSFELKSERRLLIENLRRKSALRAYLISPDDAGERKESILIHFDLARPLQSQ